MTSAFSSSEAAVLERQIDVDNGTVVKLEEIWNSKQCKQCIDWIRTNDYGKVCLQFPDEYLFYSEVIATELRNTLNSSKSNENEKKIFILADTSYGSCCVDEVAASHVEADCIIHFGNACRSETTRLPVLYCFPQLPVDIEQFCNQLTSHKEHFLNECVTIYLDIGYHHILDEGVEENADFFVCLKQLATKQLCVREYGGDRCCVLSPNNEFAVHSESLAQEHDVNVIFVYMGNDNKRFFNLSLSQKAAKWFIYNPQDGSLKEENPLIAKYIQRRYYYIEKCKDAKTLGLIVATLTANGYLDVVKRLQSMAKGRGIKTQIISVGRINPAKLANFLEIDCFVVIGCPLNSTYDSKDFYKPIVTVFEAEMALNPAWHMQYPETYITDFKQLLPGGQNFLEYQCGDNIHTDISLIDGRMRNCMSLNNKEEESPTNPAAVCEQSGSLNPRSRLEVMSSNNGLTFEDRTWQGLNPNLSENEPAILQKGLSGIPIRYTHD